MRLRSLLGHRSHPTGSKPPPEERLEAVRASPAVEAVDAELARLGSRAVAGRWPGNRGSELIVWQPFLRAAERRFGIELVERDAPVLEPSLAERLIAGFLADAEPIAPLLERLDFALLPGSERGLLVTRSVEELQVAIVEGRTVVALITPAEAASPELALAYRVARRLGTPLTVLAPEQAGLAATLALR